LKKQKNGYIFNPACESILIITVMDGNETDGAYGLPADRVFVELMGLDTLRDPFNPVLLNWLPETERSV